MLRFMYGYRVYGSVLCMSLFAVSLNGAEEKKIAFHSVSFGAASTFYAFVHGLEPSQTKKTKMTVGVPFLYTKKIPLPGLVQEGIRDIYPLLKDASRDNVGMTFINGTTANKSEEIDKNIKDMKDFVVAHMATAYLKNEVAEHKVLAPYVHTAQQKIKDIAGPFADPLAHISSGIVIPYALQKNVQDSYALESCAVGEVAAFVGKKSGNKILDALGHNIQLGARQDMVLTCFTRKKSGHDHAIGVAVGCVINFSMDLIEKSKFGARFRNYIDHHMMPFWLRPHKELLFWCCSHFIRAALTMVLSQEISKRVPKWQSRKEKIDTTRGRIVSFEI
jgi:hypothetical protein